VIAGSQDVDPAIVKFSAETFGKATACGRVFRIDDNEIDVELAT
jgi:hypothetical protein